MEEEVEARQLSAAVFPITLPQFEERILPEDFWHVYIASPLNMKQ